MRKFAVVLMVFVFMFSFGVQAKAFEDDFVSFENCISSNVPVWIGGLFNIGYERKITENLSAKVRAAYWALSGLFNQEGEIENFAMGYIGADVLFYPAGEALTGFAFGPKYDLWMGGFTALDMINNPTVGLQLHFVGAQVAHKWVFDSGFSMNIVLGGLANVAVSAQAGDEEYIGDPPLAGIFMPFFDFEIGYAF